MVWKFRLLPRIHALVKKPALLACRFDHLLYRLLL